MRILIADDDSEDLEIFHDAIAEIDGAIECISVRNGDEAIQLLSTTQVDLPDFIFLDVNMPRMNGKECLVEIKKIEALRSTPVVMYSSSSDQDERDAYLKMGAHEYLVKGWDFKELMRSLSSIIGKKDKQIP